MRFIRIKHMGRKVDINVSHIDSVVYDVDNHTTTFSVRNRRTYTIDGNWEDVFYKFLQSGAVWTDGNRYEFRQ